MTMSQALKSFKPVKYGWKTMGKCNDELLDLLKSSGEEHLWENNDCEMVQVVSPQGVVLHIWRNWYPLWRVPRWEHCVVGLSWVTHRLKPVTIQCVSDDRPDWAKHKCPCNGGPMEFVEKVREALEKAGFQVNPGFVNFEGA